MVALFGYLVCVPYICSMSSTTARGYGGTYRKGDTVASIKLTSEPYKRGRHYCFDYACLKCERVGTVVAAALAERKGGCKGCLPDGQQHHNFGRFKYEGVGELSGRFYSQMLAHAALRNIAVSADLTKEYLWELFTQQNRRCALSGILLSMNPRWGTQKKEGKVVRGLQTASLDRKDSRLPYAPGNVQWVHRDINYMKGSLDDELFILACRLVARAQRSIMLTTTITDFDQPRHGWGKGYERGKPGTVSTEADDAATPLW